MSREQRRMDRKQQQGAGSARTGASSTAPPPSRRTPVKVAGGSRFPSLPLAILGGVVLVAALIGYLIWQSNRTASGLSASEKAALDRSTDLPGTYVDPQGGEHYSGGLPGSTVLPYCDDVPQSDLAKARSGKPYAPLGSTPDAASPSAGTGTATVAATSTPAPSATPAVTGTPGDTTAAATSSTPAPSPTIPTNCHLSNPPSSGKHLAVLANVELGNGIILGRIPAERDVYDDDIEMPRESVAHILEHAGVFVGWNCADGDTACMDVVNKLKDLVDDRLDNRDDIVVMAPFRDLPPGTIGLSSWTRVLDVDYTEWDAKKGEIKDFIATHSCRFDPEGFCR